LAAHADRIAVNVLPCHDAPMMRTPRRERLAWRSELRRAAGGLPERWRGALKR
jgi:hypothetical protein